MELSLLAGDGSASAESVSVADASFAAMPNEDLVHQVVTAYMAGARSGTKAQKTRSEVRGGGAKPWRQKGTGRARAGTTRGPIWRGGGRAFAAKPRDYSQKVNRKMYRAAMRSILSELVGQGRLKVVQSFDMPTHKTKDAAAQLQSMGLSDVMIVVAEGSENMFLATRNLHWVAVVDVSEVNPVSLLAYREVLMTVDALRQVEEQLK